MMRPNPDFDPAVLLPTKWSEENEKSRSTMNLKPRKSRYFAGWRLVCSLPLPRHRHQCSVHCGG